MSKTNIKMSKPSYIIKKDDGVIVCKIKTQGDDSVFQLLECYGKNLTSKMRKRFGISYIDKELIFTAVAKHHKIDIWNEIVGKRIAEGKCKRNIYNFYHRLYDFILQEIITTDIKMLARYVDNLDYCHKREEQHLKDLIGN